MNDAVSERMKVLEYSGVDSEFSALKIENCKEDFFPYAGPGRRFADILIASVGLILALPIFIFVPLLIKFDSNGPIFYTQDRVGMNRRRRRSDRRESSSPLNEWQSDRRRADGFGKIFKLLKFRSMVNEAENHTGPVWAVDGDPRITKIGCFLRKTRLDEVPQLLNVIAGDMSLVGPRPERPFFVKELAGKVQDYERRLAVKPGITGLAQINNGYDTSLDSVKKKVRIDLTYIRERSVWMDIKILLKTAVVIFTKKGAI